MNTTKPMQSVSCMLMGALSLVPTFAKANEIFFGVFNDTGPRNDGSLTGDGARFKSVEQGLVGDPDASSGDYVQQYLRFVEVIS